MTTWYSEQPEPEFPPIKGFAWVRVLARGMALAILVFGCLGLLLLVRLIEWPLFGTHRPVTPYITTFVCRMAFMILGMRFERSGTPMRHPGAQVANHSSWLDIFALNASDQIYFVSKSEVAKWPGIGWLAKATGTVFIARRAQDAKEQQDVFQDRLLAGHRLLFFPEGTSTDGTLVLPFKSTLFAAFFNAELRKNLWIQPVSVRYLPPKDAAPWFYNWWGDMEFGPHLLFVLAASRQGGVKVQYHDPIRVSDAPDRKALAYRCELAVRSSF